MSAARKRRCGGRAVYCGKNERIRTGKIRAAGKICAGEKYVRREERQDAQKIQAESVRLYVYLQIRRRIYAARAYENRAEREKKEPCARQRRKGRKEVLRTDKNGCGKSKPRAREKACVRTGTENCGKTGKNELFLWIFHTKKANKGKKNAKNGLKKRNAVNLLAKYGQS